MAERLRLSYGRLLKLEKSGRKKPGRSRVGRCRTKWWSAVEAPRGAQWNSARLEVSATFPPGRHPLRLRKNFSSPVWVIS